MRRICRGMLFVMLTTVTCLAQKPVPVNHLPARLHFGEPARSAEEQRAREDAIFREYPVARMSQSKGPHAAARLDTKLKRTYRTRLRIASEGKPVFAGSVSAEQFGCGTGCSSLALVDVRTGSSALLLDIGEAWSNKRVEFRPESRALHVVGDVDETVPGDRWYLWTGSGLDLIAFQPLPPDCFGLNDNGQLTKLWTSAACNFMPPEEDR